MLGTRARSRTNELLADTLKQRRHDDDKKGGLVTLRRWARASGKGLGNWWVSIKKAFKAFFKFLNDLFFGIDSAHIYASTAFVTFKRSAPVRSRAATRRALAAATVTRWLFFLVLSSERLGAPPAPFLTRARLRLAAPPILASVESVRRVGSDNRSSRAATRCSTARRRSSRATRPTRATSSGGTCTCRTGA